MTNGFSAMGKEVTFARRMKADLAFKDMVKDATAEERFSCIQSVSDQLERDRPYEALATARKYLDLTGAYRLIAILLTDA